MHARSPLLFLPFFFVRSTRIHGFIPMKLSTPSRDIRFQPVSIGLYIKSIFRGNLTSLSNGHFITAILLGTRITYGAVDTTFRGDWIVIDCGIIPERWNRYSQVGKDARIHLTWKFNLKRACVLRCSLRLVGMSGVCIYSRKHLLHARLGASGVCVTRMSNWNIKWKSIFNETACDSQCLDQIVFEAHEISNNIHEDYY